MGKALQVLGGYVTAPSTTETAITMNSGDSLQIKHCREDSNIYLLTQWGLWQTAGLLRTKSPRLHDNSVGIVNKGIASSALPLIPITKSQKLIPQDTLDVRLTGSATSGDIELAALLVYYDDLPGADARLATWDEVKDNIKNIVNVQLSLTMGTAGGWSGALKLNNDFDILKADKDYALLGYTLDNEICALAIYGPDTANICVGGPGDDANKDYTSEWFINLSVKTGLPCIPIINNANKAATFVQGMNDENAATVICQLIFGEL
jgi:hypothetical protein